ncbi:MAG: alanine racemase [Bacteroidota bacterium]
MKLNLSSTEFAQRVEAQISGAAGDFTIHSVAYDSRKILDPKNTVFFALNGEFRDGHQYIGDAYKQGVRLFVISKTVNTDAFTDAQFFTVDSGLKALQRLAQKHREQFSYPVVGITGSVGKTIVKEWLYHLLSDSFHIVRSPKSYNSKLGVALSLLEMNQGHNLALIEAGISQANEMHVLERMIAPNIGVFTAFASAHAQHFASREEHLLEKEKLFIRSKKVFAGSSIATNSIQNCEKTSPENFPALLDFSPFRDQASQQNLSMAIAVAKYLGLTDEQLIPRIKTLPRLALRMETFDGINGNLVINDAYNADLDALTQSLEYQLSLAGNRLRTAIIGVDGLSDQQVQKIRHKLKPYNLYQCFFVSDNEIPPIDQINQQVVLIKGTRASQIQRIARLFQLKKHKTRVEINLSAIKNNLGYFRSLLRPECQVLVMVKASSYGSGAEKMAEFLEKNGVHYLGVAYADEGIELRKHGIRVPILVMNAEEDSFEDLIQYQLEPAIYSFSMLEEFTKALINLGLEQYPVHLKFDTGMRRLGFEPQEAGKVIDLVLAQPEIRVKSVYSHLADSDNIREKAFTEEQIAVFRQTCSTIEQRLSYPFMKHILNSEGIQRFPEAQFDMVRIGIGLYGISINKEVEKQVRKAIAWKSVISQIKTIEAGESVGYSRTFVAKKQMQIAIVPVGYADGFRRSLSRGKGGMYVNDQYCPVVGNVCMDMCMLDISSVPCSEGDDVEIIGPQLQIEKLAEQMETIPYEILTSLSKRLQRVYLEE